MQQEGNRTPRNRIAVLLVMAATALGVHAQGTTRWINGSSVNLRSQPSASSDVVARMALNAQVELLERAGDGPYCEISAPGAGGKALRGFTACQYLAPQPLDLSKIAGWRGADGNPNPAYDPAKAFGIAPAWVTLQEYANFLEATRLTDDDRANPPQGVRTDSELERMKQHLAKGVYGPAPAPFQDWADMKRAPASKSFELQTRLNAWDIEFADQRSEVVFNLVKAIELQPVRSSLFMEPADIAPPHEDAVAMSGRFHLIHLWRTKRRGQGEADNAGLWDMNSTTVSLARPVAAVTLHRDGRLDSARSFGLQTMHLRPDTADGPMCEGYEDGFAFGDADPAVWRFMYPSMGKEEMAMLPKRVPGSILRFHLRKELALPAAQVFVTRHALDRQSTGFIGATVLHFDLDHDGVFDLAVWEGTGHGPGHLGPRTETDDAWFRLFFVNIAGRWKVLGSDRFGYGCGC